MVLLIVVSQAIVIPSSVYSFSSGLNAGINTPAPEIILTTPQSEVFVGESIQLILESINFDGSTTDISSHPDVEYLNSNFDKNFISISNTGLVVAGKRGVAYVLLGSSCRTKNQGRV